MKKTIKLTTPGNYIFTLDQKGQELEVLAFLQAKDQENLNLNISIIHKTAQTKAKVIIKATVDDQAQVKITGKIKINKNCPQVKSFLTEKVLLLSKTARAQAIPDLEILSDEVSCSHSLSISPIPEEQIFYLKARGISEDEAKKMIAEAFLTN